MSSNDLEIITGSPRNQLFESTMTLSRGAAQPTTREMVTRRSNPKSQVAKDYEISVNMMDTRHPYGTELQGDRGCPWTKRLVLLMF